MSWSILPNLITVLRLILLLPLSYFLLQNDYQTAVVIFFIAGFSDALDGFLAKHFNWTSRFGAIMDPIADKALLVVTMAILTASHKIMLSLFITVALRDLLIVSGAYYYHWRLGPFDMSPSYLSKFNTFIQILLVTSILVHLGFINLPEYYLQLLIGLTFVTTISSGIHYFTVWGRKMQSELNKKKP